MYFEGNSATWEHQDTYYLDSEKVGCMIAGWIALENIKDSKLQSKLNANYIQWDSTSGKWQVNRWQIREFLEEGEKLSKGNIVLWAKGALAKGDSLNIIDDQFRAPTLAEDLADICILAAKKKAFGIFNASGKDIMSIYEIVERIAKHYGNSTDNLNKISTATLKQKAGRPPKTGFILDKSRKELGYNPHSFEECLTIIDQQLKDK